jgi:hypothetical protein
MAPKEASRRAAGRRYATNSGGGNAVEAQPPRSSHSGDNGGVSQESRGEDGVRVSGGRPPAPLDSGEDRLMRLLLRVSREWRSDEVETGSPVAGEYPC